MRTQSLFKRWLAVLLLPLAAVSANAYDAQIDGIYYNFSDNEATVTYGTLLYRGSIVIPESVTYNGTVYPVTCIRNYAFEGCSGLTSITIPESVTTIGESAFEGCRGLTSITIPESVTTIGESTFYGCSGLTSITIPESVTTIGASAFSRCRGLTSIKVAEGNTKYDSRNDCNAIIETATNTLISGCQNTTIPNSVTSIGNDAFFGCRGLTSITIPESVTSIGTYAFGGCSGLTSVTIPESVTTIGESAFEGCSGLTSVTIPESVTTIGESAFYGCSGLTSITIPESVTSIGGSAFRFCSGLTSVIIGSNVTSIGKWAFSGCSGLAEVYCIADNVPETGDYVFGGYLVASATLYVPESAIDNYTTTSPWSEFGTILPLTQDMIDGIDCPRASVAIGDDDTVNDRYDVQGRRLSSPQRGINIIRYSDGTTRKILVK